MASSNGQPQVRAYQSDDERRQLLGYNAAAMPTPHYYQPSQQLMPGYGGVMMSVTNQLPNPQHDPQLSEAHKSQPADMASMVPGEQMLTKSYSVHADGALGYLTPLQLGRHELYEMVPFTAVFGMQLKERNITKAFASYAADLDTLEHDRWFTRGQINIYPLTSWTLGEIVQVYYPWMNWKWMLYLSRLL